VPIKNIYHRRAVRLAKEKSMSEPIRSFFAFDIDNEDVRRKMAKGQRLLAETGADIKLVETENIHVTMRFLGNVAPSMVDSLFKRMKQIQFAPFAVQLKGIGVFPSLSYPRVVWIGITEGANELRGIFDQLEPQLRELGFAPDQHGFSPHLTIARVRSARNKPQLIDFVKKNTEFDFGKIQADCLRLKQSILSPKGPTYSTLKEFCPGK